MVFPLPVRYVEPVYRPPSEANSLILPLTDGCSWNQCTFCEMYTASQKKFRARDAVEVMEGIARTGELLGSKVRRVFLADGDALVLPTRRLLDVLARVKKGETFETTREALDKLGEAGIKRSVMILNGLGGPALSAQHAENSARLLNVTQPEYVATLVVSFPLGEERFKSDFPGWRALTQRELFVEMERFLHGLELRRSVFRSDHASNWLVLKGTLGGDKPRLLQEVRQAIACPETAQLRPSWLRGL